MPAIKRIPWYNKNEEYENTEQNKNGNLRVKEK